MTTLAVWYAALKGVTVAGTTALTEPPMLGQVVTAKIPCLYVDTVKAEDASAHAGDSGGQRLLLGRIVIITGIGGQDRHALRWSDTITMADTLTAALAAMTLPTNIDTFAWNVTVTPNLDNSGYWAVFANVQAQEWT